MSQRTALLVGNSEYQDHSIQDMAPIANDIRALGDVLQNPNIGGFDTVETFINATYSEILHELPRFFSSLQSDDTVLLYFAGHGLLDRENQFFLGVRDTSISDLSTTAVSTELLSHLFNTCLARQKFILMDCANSDVFLRNVGRLQNCSILNASYRFPERKTPQRDTAFQRLIFTQYLIEGLETGKADVDMDGSIGVYELCNYIYQKLEVDHSQQTKPHLISFDNFAGDASYIARNPGLFVKKDLLHLRKRAKSPSIAAKLKVIDTIVGMGISFIAADNELLQSATAVLNTLKKDQSKDVARKAAGLFRQIYEHKDLDLSRNKERKEKSVSLSEKPKRVVNTGFADRDTPNTLIGPDSALSTDKNYFFWLEAGDFNPSSIEETPTDLPADVPVGAALKVVLFGFKDGFQLDQDHSTGVLELRGNGTVQVIKQPQNPENLSPDSDLLKRRLFFPIRTLSSEGTYNLRCNIYYEQILLQSRLIHARIMKTPTPAGQSLRSVLDYNLTKSFNPLHLQKLLPHKLSLMVNNNGDGTHSFRFVGQGNFQQEAVIDGQVVKDLIKQARGTLRSMTYGDTAEWRGQKYLYEAGLDLERLRIDLVRLAINGYRFYDGLINGFTGGVDEAEKLATLMQGPGIVQIALRESGRLVVPAALFYDHPLRTRPDLSGNLKRYSLCPEFLEALFSSKPLENCQCFQGHCPSRGEMTIVCPSGFWGFRHLIGVPISVATAPAVPTEISYNRKINFSVNVSTDKAFSLREAHEERLSRLSPSIEWYYAKTMDEAIENLRSRNPHLVYFYCHGGVHGNIPYIQVGDPGEGGLTRDIVRSEKIFWRDPAPHPFVFINGCHTSALDPEVALDIVNALIENAQASGVMGTEITVFEPLATSFAEAFWEHFFDGVNVGEAVRQARLSLLKDGNPLGLVYIPFAMASLHMEQSTRS